MFEKGIKRLVEDVKTYFPGGEVMIHEDGELYIRTNLMEIGDKLVPYCPTIYAMEAQINKPAPYDQEAEIGLD